MTDAERLELECLRAYVRAHHWLKPREFQRYMRLVEREEQAGRVARVLESFNRDRSVSNGNDENPT